MHSIDLPSPHPSRVARPRTARLSGSGPRPALGADRRWGATVFVAAILVFLLAGRLHDAVAYGLVPVGKIFIPLGVLAVLADSRLGVISRLFGTLPGRGLLLFTAAIFLSVPFSYLKSGSLEIGVSWITQGVPLLLIIAAGIRGVRDVERLMHMFVLVAIASGLLVLGGKALVFDGPDGPRTTLAGSYDPNDFALAMSVCAAFCLWAIRDRSKLWRLLGVAGLLLASYCVLRTYSRGGALAFGTLVLATAVVARRSIPGWVRLAIIPCFAIGLAFAPSKYIDRLASIGSLNQDYNTTGREGRKAIWTRAMGYVARRPLTGVGVGQFVLAEGRYITGENLQGFKWSAAHNMFVECAAEMGIPGLVGLCLMLYPIVTLWRRLRQLTPASDDELRLQRAVEAMAFATLTFTVGAFFLSATFSPFVQFLTAISIAIHALPLTRALTLRAPRARARAARAAVSTRR